MGIDVFAIDIFDTRGFGWSVPIGQVGYFRDSYQKASLANWLAANIDSTARGRSGLALFSDADDSINTPAWRDDLLLNARKWYTAAVALAGKRTFLGTPGVDIEIVDEAGTLAYIEWTAELLRFAEVVYATGSRVEVHG